MDIKNPPTDSLLSEGFFTNKAPETGMFSVCIQLYTKCIHILKTAKETMI